MEKNNGLIILGVILILGVLYFAGFFNSLLAIITPGTYITIPGADLKFTYQEMSSIGCAVKLQKISTSATTWVGAYDVTNYGKRNADNTLQIGWVTNVTYPTLVTLLKDNPPTESCLAYSPTYCINSSTKCDGTTYYTCSKNAWISQGNVDGKCGYSTTITREQLGTYITQWINGQITRDSLGTYIVKWINGVN